MNHPGICSYTARVCSPGSGYFMGLVKRFEVEGVGLEGLLEDLGYKPLKVKEKVAVDVGRLAQKFRIKR